jgi:putative hydrolase of the HAD superfamily
MKGIKFVYFDIGGVLLDWRDYFKSAAKEFGIKVGDIIALWDEIDDDLTRGKIGAEDYWKKIVDRYQLKNDEGYDLLTSWVGDYKPRREVHELVEELAKKYNLGIISNIYNGMFPKLLSMGKIPDIKWNSVILSNEIGYKKPEKEIFEIATKKADVKSNEVFFVDDRQDFLDGAKSYGWQGFRFDEKTVNESVDKLKQLLLK